MPILREVFAQPAGGWPDRPWDRDSAVDAFCRVAVGVGEQLSWAVAEAGVVAAYRQFRVSTVATSAHAVGVDTIELKRTGWEGCRAEVPREFAELDRGSQLETVRNTFAFALRAHAELRSWDRSALERALASGLDDRMDFSWEGVPRTSRDKRHSAQLRGVFFLDGYARVSVVVRDERSGRESITKSFRCGSSVASLKRTDATAGWADQTQFVFAAGTDESDSARVIADLDGKTAVEDDGLLTVSQPATGQTVGPLPVVHLPPLDTRRLRT
jgi:hypothetical protein